MSKIKQTFVFFENEETAKISDNELYVNGNDSLVITAEGSGQVEIQGLADINSDIWTPIALINKSDFSVGQNISKAGIYSCSVDGYWKVRAEIKSVTSALSICVNLM